MSTEQAIERHAAELLEQAGFYVQLGARLSQQGAPGKLGRMRADILAWGPDGSGGYRPELLVEVFRSGTKSTDAALAQLSTYAVLAGTERALVFDGAWHEADPTFQELVGVDTPTPAHADPDAVLPASVVEDIWVRALASSRDRGDRLTPESLKRVLAEDQGINALARRGPAQRLAIARAFHPEAAGLRGYFGSNPLDLALARLLHPEPDWTIVDPWCGLGGRLLAIAEHTQRSDVSHSLHGFGGDTVALEFADVLRRFAGVDIDLAHVDFFAEPRNIHGEGLVSLVPMMKLRDRRSKHRDSIEAAMAMTGQWLDSGLKRAVLGVHTGFLSSMRSRKVREIVAQHHRLVAVIELPKGLYPGTIIVPAVVVLEPGPHEGPALFARLGSDWAEQLGEHGDFFRAYTENLSNR